MSRNGIPALGFHTFFVAFMLAPLFAVCLVAFTPESYLSMPLGGFSLRWFRALLHRPDFLHAAWLSVRLAAAASTLAVAISIPTALIFARYRFTGRDALGALFMSPLTIPHVVLGIALLRYFTQIGLGATFAGLMAGHVLLVAPFALRLVMASAIGMDERIHQVAISLGAGSLVTLRRITLPLILPGVMSGWMLAFIVSFDEVAMTVFLAAPGTDTLPLRMLNHIQETTDPLVAAIGKHVFAGEKIHGDDTTVPVLAPGLGRTATGRLWVYVRDDRLFAGPAAPAAVYFYSPDRGGGHPAKHMANFTGFLQADGYAGYVVPENMLSLGASNQDRQSDPDACRT